MFERLPSPRRSRGQLLLFALLIAAGVAAFALPLCRRCLTLGDEGYLLLQSLDMLHGKVLYRDLDAFVTPGMWFVLAGLFSLVEPSVIASRIPVFIAFLAMVGVSYRIVALMAGPRSGLTAVGLMLACSVWAFPAWTFAFYSPFSVLFALAGLERLLVWEGRKRSERGGGRDLVWSGVLFGVAIVFKQNYGAFALIGGAIGVAAIHFQLCFQAQAQLSSGKPLQEILRGVAADGARMALGLAAVGLPLVGYFAYEGVLPELFQSLVVHPFEFSGKHDIPYVGLGKLFDADFMSESVEMMTYGAQPTYRTVPPGGLVAEWSVIERLHVLMYWIPVVIFVVGGLLALLPRRSREAGEEGSGPVDGRLLAVLAVTFFLYLGVFPRADFNHLINVYQGVVVAGVVVVHALLGRLSQPRPLWLRGLLAAGSALLGLYVAVAGYWYWELMVRMDTPVSQARGGVLVSGTEASRLQFMLDAIDRLIPPGEALLTIPDIAMLNFLAARPMPSAYYNLYEHHIAHDQGATVVEGAERHGVNLAITRYNDFFSDRTGLRDYAPELVSYLETHYQLTWTVGNEDYLIFRRREVPVSREASQGLLEHCEPGRGLQQVRHHLFFDALYHSPGIGLKLPRSEVQTVCRLRVPAEGAELVSRIGVRKPIRVVERGSLTVEVLVAREGELPVALLSQVFELRPKNPRRYYFPPHGEYRIDLSAYAGEDVVLVLRTIREGRVLVSRANFRRFGTLFEDPRIVPRALPSSNSSFYSDSNPNPNSDSNPDASPDPAN